MSQQITELDLKISWLSGLWDGEGSIGLSKVGKGWRLNAQMSMCDAPTIFEALAVMEEMGVHGRNYTYQERQPHHKDAWYLRVNGINNIRELGIQLLPYSITKREAWELAVQFADSRIQAAGGLQEDGTLKRGGKNRTGYSAEDLGLIDSLRSLTRRPTRVEFEVGA